MAPRGKARLRRAISAALLAAPLLVAGCGDDSPTKPHTHTLTGRVRLVGTVSNAVGDSTDVQLVDDADSVLVYLYHGPTREDSTRTTSGAYHFSGLSDSPSGGPYSVATILWGDLGDTVSVGNVTADVAADTLVLESSPTMIGFPNPFQFVTDVRFALALPGPVEVIARKASGLTVRSLVQVNLPAGYHDVAWDAKDDSGTVVPAGPYWILFQAGTDYRARLLVKM